MPLLVHVSVICPFTVKIGHRSSWICPLVYFSAQYIFSSPDYIAAALPLDDDYYNFACCWSLLWGTKNGQAATVAFSLVELSLFPFVERFQPFEDQDSWSTKREVMGVEKETFPKWVTRSVYAQGLSYSISRILNLHIIATEAQHCWFKVCCVLKNNVPSLQGVVSKMASQTK